MEDDGIDSLIRHLERGETRPALEAVRRLGEAARRSVRVRRAFLGLLARRGYFVASAPELAASLEEIRGVGEGFDLCDLANVIPIRVKELRHERPA